MVTAIRKIVNFERPFFPVPFLLSFVISEAYEKFYLDFEAVMLYSMLRTGGVYDQGRYHLRSF